MYIVLVYDVSQEDHGTELSDGQKYSRHVKDI